MEASYSAGRYKGIDRSGVLHNVAVKWDKKTASDFENIRDRDCGGVRHDNCLCKGINFFDGPCNISIGATFFFIIR